MDRLLGGRQPKTSPDDRAFWRHWSDPSLGCSRWSSGLAARISSELARESIPHAITGAVAMACHGYVRATQDLGILVVATDMQLPRVFEIVREQGAFHHVSKRHLHGYCDEFEFRWNTRHMTDGERTLQAIAAGDGLRLQYGARGA